ncbi:Os07g0679050, partial [Oryza sativa Japonica Group]
EQRRRRHAQHHVRAAAVSPEEVVPDADGELLQQRRARLGLHVRVPQDERRAGLPRLAQLLQLLHHALLHLRARRLHHEPHLLRHRRRRRRRRDLHYPVRAARGVHRGHAVVGGLVAEASPERVRPDHRERVLALVAAVVELLAPAAGVAAAVVQRVQLDEGGEALDELRLERVHVLVHVAVAVPHDAPVRPVPRRADAADEVALGGKHVRYRDGLDADEHQHAVERREVGDEAGEVGRHAGGEVGVDEADARDAHHAQLVAQGEQPLQGHLVVQVELVLLDGGVVPDEHDGHEDERQHDRQPRPLPELDQRRREVEHLDGAEEEEEDECQRRTPVPTQHDHQGCQACRHQHHRDHCQSCT